MIFGDDARRRMIGTCTLIFLGLSILKEVLLVEGLMINLISISELCEENVFVRFIKDKCIVVDRNQYQIIEGRRSFNHCYLLTSTGVGTRETWIQQFEHTCNSMP